VALAPSITKLLQFGVGRRGFYIPLHRMDDVRASEFRGYKALEKLFAAKHGAFAELITAIDSYAEALAAISGLKPPQPRFEQDWFPRLDAAAYYTLVRRTRPKRIIEVGSGHSTRFACRAIADEGISCEVTAIDPRPRADIARLPIVRKRQPLQEVPLEYFERLQAGDIFIVDSSHVFMPGTDVDFAINQVLPMLPAGVLVSFHDIFLPDAYPDEWPFGIYNEQNAVAPLLQGGYEIVFASAYVGSRMKAELDATIIARLPLVDTAVENGFWLKKL